MKNKATVESDEEVIVDEQETEQETEEEVESTDESSSEEETSEGSSEESSDDDSEDDDELIVTIGDAPAPEPEVKEAPAWVRDLRKSHREIQKENRELKKKLEQTQAPVEKKIELGPKPQLSDLDYDTDLYDKELQKWYDSKRAVDEQAKKAEADKKAQQKAWQERLNAYNDNREKLNVKDFDDAEEMVLENFDQTQQGIVVQGADDPALVVYALYKNPDRLKEISNIKDPVKFAFAVAKLEKDLKVGKRKAPPPPEKTVTGTAPKSGSVDSELERLREEAARTGNYTKVHQYKQKRRDLKN